MLSVKWRQFCLGLNVLTIQARMIIFLCSGRYQRGALTFFAINMKNDSAETLYFSGILSMQNVDVYMLTPGDADGLLSK